jgi:CDP-4-dehydro-6-deoxyglucose reductase, E1
MPHSAESTRDRQDKEAMTATITTAPGRLDWPLMRNNITRADLDALVTYLNQPEPMLTQGAQVRAFEQEWSQWLGVPHSVFVNSGASANLLTLSALRELHGPGEVIVPTLTWVSDIASVLQAGFEPIFVDIRRESLGMDDEQVLASISPRTRAVFLTHILGYNALTERLVTELQQRGIPLIEDVCESHGASFRGRKLGTIGAVSNFSFYYAHHMSTIEGGMISTADPDFYEVVRVMRSHGMVRESTSPAFKARYAAAHPDLHPDFIFAFPAYNMRSTELNAVIGRSQLTRLDTNNELRRRNLDLFLGGLDPRLYWTEFDTEGSSNYAFTLVIRDADPVFRDRVMARLTELGVEFRRGTSGGGNQLRQPYLRSRLPHLDPASFTVVDHVHFYGFYIGNYPSLDPDMIPLLCRALNELGTA